MAYAQCACAWQWVRTRSFSTRLGLPRTHRPRKLHRPACFRSAWGVLSGSTVVPRAGVFAIGLNMVCGQDLRLLGCGSVPPCRPGGPRSQAALLAPELSHLHVAVAVWAFLLHPHSPPCWLHLPVAFRSASVPVTVTCCLAEPPLPAASCLAAPGQFHEGRRFCPLGSRLHACSTGTAAC